MRVELGLLPAHWRTMPARTLNFHVTARKARPWDIDLTCLQLAYRMNDGITHIACVTAPQYSGHEREERVATGLRSLGLGMDAVEYFAGGNVSSTKKGLSKDSPRSDHV